MTKQQLYLFSCLYLVILVVAVLTRATPRRIAGALVAAAGVPIPVQPGTTWRKRNNNKEQFDTREDA